MTDRCAYCGREEGGTNVDGYVYLSVCPVCTAIACPVCLALVEFNEETEDGMVTTWRAAVCKVHLPWNIIEGVKRRVKGGDNSEQNTEVVGFDVDIPDEFIHGDVPAMEFPELSRDVNFLGALTIDKIAAYRLGTKAAIRVRVKAHRLKGGT